jgi:hypothetical protein
MDYFKCLDLVSTMIVELRITIQGNAWKLLGKRKCIDQSFEGSLHD